LKTKNISLGLVLPLLIIFTLISCEKEPGEIGLNLVSNNDLPIVFSDTTTIWAQSERIDSVRTDEGSSSLIGSFYDPWFGVTTASLYTQVRLSLSAPDYGSNPVCDSVVFSLVYNDCYGDTSQTQTLYIHRLEDAILPDSVYYSTYNLAYNPEPLTTIDVLPSPSDSVVVDEEKQAPQLRIPLDPALGDEILNASDDQLIDNDAFTDFFKGLYITTDKQTIPGEGCIMIFNQMTDLSRFIIYYHNDENDSLSSNFNINTTSVGHFNNFEHYGYQEADPLVKAQIFNEDTSGMHSNIFLQEMGGVRVKIRFPYLKNYINDGQFSVNEAQLIIKNKGDEDSYPLPSSLVIKKVEDSTGYYYYLPDASESSGYYDGSYSTGQYRFRITRYIQRLLLEKEYDSCLVLMMPRDENTYIPEIEANNKNRRAYRMVSGGSNDPESSIELKLTLTKILDQ